MFDSKVYQRHRRRPIHVSLSTRLFPVCLKCRLYHQHKHKYQPENSNPVWKQWCQSHHGNCSYKWCLFILLSSSAFVHVWHSSVISFCHNARASMLQCQGHRKGITWPFAAHRMQEDRKVRRCVSGIWMAIVDAAVSDFVTYSCHFFVFWSFYGTPFNEESLELQW